MVPLKRISTGLVCRGINRSWAITEEGGKYKPVLIKGKVKLTVGGQRSKTQDALEGTNCICERARNKKQESIATIRVEWVVRGLRVLF